MTRRKTIPPGSTPFDFVVYCTDSESAMLSALGTVRKLEPGRYVVTCKTESERDFAAETVRGWGYSTQDFLLKESER